jgi:hypothetical protein
VVAFIFGLAGSAVLLDNSARDSHFQPRIRESMRRLIINAHHEPSRQTLAMIQEGVSNPIVYIYSGVSVPIGSVKLECVFVDTTTN